MKNINKEEIDFIVKQVQSGLNAPLTSSMGRLFDAVSALIGIRQVIQYEAQAACEMETIARRCKHKSTRTYPFAISVEQDKLVVLLKDTLEAVVDDLRNGADTATIARTFHSTIARIIADMCGKISNATGIRNVALSGGVFQNRLLLRDVMLFWRRKVLQCSATGGYHATTAAYHSGRR